MPIPIVGSKGFRESRKLNVGNLPDNIDLAELKRIFERYGKVLDVRMQKEMNEHIAVVCFMDMKSAVRAHLDKPVLNYHSLVTSYYRPGIPIPAEFWQSIHHAREQSEITKLRKQEAAQLSLANANVSEPFEDKTHRFSHKQDCQTKDLDSIVENEDALKEACKHDPLDEMVISCCDEDSITTSPAQDQTGVVQHKEQVDSTQSSASSNVAAPTARSNTTVLDKNTFIHGTIIVWDLPVNTSELCVRERVYYKFRRYGRVCAVKIRNTNNKRFAIVRFSSNDDALETYKELDGQILMWDKNLRFEPYVDPVPVDRDMDKEDNLTYRDKATRALYAGNLHPAVTSDEVRSLFASFGDIWQLDIKQTINGSPYAFVYMDHIRCVARAIRVLNGLVYRSYTLKLGFGRCQMSRILWLGDLHKNATVSEIADFLGVPCNFVVHEPSLRESLIILPDAFSASAALNNSRNRLFKDRCIEIDYASKDYLRTTVFGEILIKQFPSLEDDFSDQGTSNIRKRVLLDVTEDRNKTMDAGLSQLTLPGGQSMTSRCSHRTEDRNRCMQSHPVLNLNYHSSGIVGDIDLRFLSTPPSTSCLQDDDSCVTPTLPQKRRHMDQHTEQTLLPQKSDNDNAACRLSKISVKVEEEIHTLMSEMESKISYIRSSKLTGSHVSKAPSSGLTVADSMLALNVGCPHFIADCHCTCFWYLYGDRLLGHYVIFNFVLRNCQAQNCDGSTVTSDTHQSIDCYDRLVRDISTSSKYCIVMYDKRLCCSSSDDNCTETTRWIRLGTGKKIRLTYLPGECYVSKDLKELSGISMLSTFYRDCSILVIIYDEPIIVEG